MAASGGAFAPIAMRVIRHAFKKTSKIIKARLEKVSSPLQHHLQPAIIRNAPRQPLHRIASLRQNKGRWYTTHRAINASLRRFMSSVSEGGAKYDRSSFPKSSTATAVSRLTARAPFASTLRPNLTGGALPRTAGGYGLGSGRVGGARYFSHTPAAPAQVVNNVSAAFRAFWLSGQKASFDGMNSAGEKRFRSVSALRGDTLLNMLSIPKSSPGSYVEFHFSPTVTAISPLGASFSPTSDVQQSSPTLNTEGFLDVLSVDFSRALKDLAAVLNDLKRLSSLGDLPVSLEVGSVLRVRFPGCDAETVERLCDEVGVQRGLIYQDPEFISSVGGEIALLFPFAPSAERSISYPGGSMCSQRSDELEGSAGVADNSWLEGYESMEDSESEFASSAKPTQLHNSSDFEGVEGIYRFLEQCDNARKI